MVIRGEEEKSCWLTTSVPPDSTIELPSAERLSFWVVIRLGGFCVEHLQIVTLYADRISFYFRRSWFYFARSWFCVARCLGCDASPLLWAHSALRREHDVVRAQTNVVRSDTDVVRFRTIRTTFYAHLLTKNYKQTLKKTSAADNPKR